MALKTSKKGMEFIRKYEGFRAKKYTCAGGFPTIGIGTVIDTKAEEWLLTATITESQAYDLLQKDLAQFERVVNSSVIKPITQNQFDALISFVYNMGPNAFKKSTLLKKVNLNPIDPLIADEFRKWRKAGGKINDGLVKRREAEIALYFS
jgi:lysozyme